MHLLEVIVPKSKFATKSCHENGIWTNGDHIGNGVLVELLHKKAALVIDAPANNTRPDWNIWIAKLIRKWLKQTREIFREERSHGRKKRSRRFLDLDNTSTKWRWTSSPFRTKKYKRISNKIEVI